MMRESSHLSIRRKKNEIMQVKNLVRWLVYSKCLLYLLYLFLLTPPFHYYPLHYQFSL